MANKRSSDDQASSTPLNFPNVTPRTGTANHDFTLQAVMEMQHTLGNLVAKTDRLIVDVKSQGEKVDSLRLRFSWFSGIAAAAGFLIATILATAKFFPIAWVK